MVSRETISIQGPQHTQGGTQGGLGEEADSAIGPRGEDPRLGGVEGHVQNAQVAGQRVAPQHLHRDQQWVLQQVAVGEGDGVGSGRHSSPGWGRAGGGLSSHLYTIPWQTMTLPSSEPDAKSGYRAWKATALRAFLWCLQGVGWVRAS